MTKTHSMVLPKQSDSNWRWVPLIFSSFFFLPLGIMYPNVELGTLGWAILVYCTFLYLFYRTTLSDKQHLHYWLGATLLLCSIGTWVTPGTQALFGYVAFFCGLHYSFNRAMSAFGFILLTIIASAISFDQVNIYFILPAVLTSTGCVFYGYTMQKELIFEAKEKQSKQQIEQLAAIAERERIARDLHDIIGHSLTSISLKSDLAQQLANKDKIAQAVQQINEVAALSRDTLGQVRQAVTGLKASSFSTTLTKLCSQLEQQGFKVTLNCDDVLLPAHIEATITLILTEAVTNILRHSKGDSVNIRLTLDEQNTNLTISDNGQPNKLVYSNGLTGMLDRCQQLNGNMTVNTHDQFSIAISLPIIKGENKITC